MISTAHQQALGRLAGVRQRRRAGPGFGIPGFGDRGVALLSNAGSNNGGSTSAASANAGAAPGAGLGAGRATGPRHPNRNGSGNGNRGEGGGGKGPGYDSPGSKQQGGGGKGKGDGIHPWQILGGLDTGEPLDGSQLFQAARALTAMGNRGLLKGYNLTIKQLENEQREEAAGLGKLGTELQGNVGSVY